MRDLLHGISEALRDTEREYYPISIRVRTVLPNWGCDEA